MSDEEILEHDFYDLCGCAAVFMTDQEKVDYWRELFNDNETIEPCAELLT